MTGRARANDASLLGAVAIEGSSLGRAAELGRCAGGVGFDWTTAMEVRGKVLEELAELDAAVMQRVASGCAMRDGAVLEELGDLLFAIANWGRHLGADPEAALIGANAKFERRFSWMERLARERNIAFDRLSAQAWEALWHEAKAAVG